MRTCDGGWVIITAFFFRVTARVWVCVAREAKDPPLHTHAKRICPLEADVSALLEISHTCGHIPHLSKSGVDDSVPRYRRI